MCHVPSGSTEEKGFTCWGRWGSTLTQTLIFSIWNRILFPGYMLTSPVVFLLQTILSILSAVYIGPKVSQPDFWLPLGYMPLCVMTTSYIFSNHEKGVSGKYKKKEIGCMSVLSWAQSWAHSCVVSSIPLTAMLLGIYPNLQLPSFFLAESQISQAPT